jgi:hypothetical protein
MKSRGDQWVLRHTNLNEHNHPPTPNAFSLQPHISRPPGFAEATSVAKTHRGILTFSESKEVLKKMGLTVEPNRYYNLIRKEQSQSLSPQEEALMLLHYLESRNVHVVVDEQYILDERGDKKDRVIICIVWWTQDQIRMARRFVSDMLAETDATFNTNEKRLLLQSFVGIDNTNSTFQFLQAFSTAESARNIRFILQVLQDHFFYDCPGFAVLAGDFSSGLSAGFAQKAAQDTEDQQKQLAQKEMQVEWEDVPEELQLESLDYNPLPTAIPTDMTTNLTLKQSSLILIGSVQLNLW